MNFSHINRLKEEHKKGLQLCEEKILQWEKFKSDYEALKQCVETLPDALSYDITVPFGPNAFTLGKLVHTNEVMVLLGDNWFAEVSGKQAAAIANRRIEQCSRMLNDLANEKLQFENWLSYTQEVTNESLVEIVEEYDEEKEKIWREQHSKNVRDYHQKLANERKKSYSNEDNAASNSEDEFIAKLKNLDLCKTAEQAKLSESEECDNDILEQRDLFESETNVSNNADNEVLEKSKKPLLRLNIDCSNEQNTKYATDSANEDDGSKSDDTVANLENCNSEANEKHVRWQDLSKLNIKKITFKHSKSKYHTHPKHPIKSQDSSESEESLSLIQSPSDIYKHFGNLFQANSPKSILKVKNSPTTPEEYGSFFPMDEIVPKENSLDLKSENIAFTDKVIERSSPMHIPGKKTSSSRPLSHFKSSRKNRKR